MKRPIHTGFILALVLLQSCFKEIDTVPIPRTIEESFTVQHSIKTVQSYYRFYQNTVLEIYTTSPFLWDLAFESAGAGSRVLLGWGSFSTAIGTGKFDFSEVTQDLILDLIGNSETWAFDDPTFVNTIDSLALTNHWEDGEIYIQNRGLTDDNYYAIQFVSSNEASYTFKYASARSLAQVNEATVYRSSGYNYVYYSFDTQGTVPAEPDRRSWDILFTPYRGWWETSTPGIYAPFNMSGIMINNEYGVRVARVFDPEVSFEELDRSSVDVYEFTDMKGAIGANWKVLGDQNSGNIYSMDPDKKYLLEKVDFETGDIMYFKLQMVDYKLNGQDHFPTVEFKFLGTR